MAEVLAQTPRNNMVSDGCRGGGVCRTPGRECLFWPMPPYYSYYLLLLVYSILVSRIRGAGDVQRTHLHMATVKTPARRAKHVKLVQIVYYYCWLASSDNLLQCTYNYVFGKYFFASSIPSLTEVTRKPFINLVSLSQAYHFITYNRSSTHIDNEDTL